MPERGGRVDGDRQARDGDWGLGAEMRAGGRAGGQTDRQARNKTARICCGASDGADADGRGCCVDLMTWAGKGDLTMRSFFELAVCMWRRILDADGF
jgi:hypothetical protein